MSRKPISNASGASRRGAAARAKEPQEKLPQRKLLASAVASCLMLGTPAAFGQSTGSNLRGHVRGESAPVANTEVVATNIATGAVRRTQTSANGRYVLIGLDPGTYRVRAGDAVEIVTLAVASNSTLNLEAGDEAEEVDLETITVVGQRAEVDVLTSEVGAIVSPRLISELPQATRNFLEFADTVPGMAFTINPRGFTSLTSGATGERAANLYIDGVGQKNYVTGGIAGQHETRGSPFPQLAIGQYKVITSNYKAEYGEVSGAALTAVTRSGTNQFEAEAFYRFTNEGLRTTRPDEEAPGEEKVDSQTEEYGFAIGGPIIEDRLHYFLTYSYKDLVTPRTVSPNTNASDFVQFLPADVQAQFGPNDLPFEEDLVFGKLSWQVTDKDLLDLSFEYRDEVQVDLVGNQRGPDHGRDTVNNTTRTTLLWERSSYDWFNELRFSVEDTDNSPFPNGGIGNGILYVVFNRRADGSVENQWHLIDTGPASGFDAKARQQKGWLIADDLTFTGFDWQGDHTFKIGASYRDIELTTSDAGSINPQFFFEVTTAGVAAAPYQVSFLNPSDVPGLRGTVVTDGSHIGLYAQDDWAVNEHLILNIGIRWDYERNPAFTDYVTPQGLVDGLMSDDPANPGQPWADRLLASGVDINDYISTGDNREDYTGAWAPRFGFSYDLNGDEQHVIHGGAGRSYDRNLFANMALEKIKGALSFTTMKFQDPATGECFQEGGICVPWDPAYLEQGIPALSPAVPPNAALGERFLLNNELSTPYADQYSLGMANQVGDWVTDVTVQRILSYDGFIYTLLHRYPDGSFFNASGGQPWGESVPGGFGNTILGDNGVETKNTQILISARKPYDRDSGWGLSLAYTGTDAEENRGPNAQFAFNKARISDYPFITAEVPEHRFVGAGSIDGPWGLTFGAKIVLETPTPINEIRNYGFVAPDGSHSQPVSIAPPGTGSFLIGGDIWGYRTVDFQATKVFTFGEYELTARVNLLNAFDYENLTQFTIDVPQTGVFAPDVTVNEFGDMQYVPRTLSFEIGMRF